MAGSKPDCEQGLFEVPRAPAPLTDLPVKFFFMLTLRLGIWLLASMSMQESWW